MKGSLKSLIKKKGRFSEKKAVKILKKIVKSYKFLHDEEVVHRDIKPDNVLYNEWEEGEYELKFCDFGLAKNHLSTLNSASGTPLYMAP